MPSCYNRNDVSWSVKDFEVDQNQGWIIDEDDLADSHQPPVSPLVLGPLLGARDLLLPEVVVVLVDLLLQRLLAVPE